MAFGFQGIKNRDTLAITYWIRKKDTGSLVGMNKNTFTKAISIMIKEMAMESYILVPFWSMQVNGTMEKDYKKF